MISRRSTGDSRILQEAFHHHLAGQGAGDRRALAGSQQTDGEQHGGDLAAEHRIEQGIGLAQIGDLGQAVGMEDGAGGDQDRGIDEQREAERAIGIADIRLDGAWLWLAVECPAGRREQAAVQVEVMRHHGRADDAEAEQQHGRVG